MQLGMTVTGGALLTACGGGGGTATTTDTPIVVVPGQTPSSPVGPASSGVTSTINLALVLAYVGAQYYGIAAGGTGLPGDMTGGVGRAGLASGARAVAFADPVIAQHAAELAADKAGHVAALRGQLAAAAAAQPMVDLSPAGSFSRAAQQVGLVAAGTTFDPYVGDVAFLTGAFLIENAVAAAHRTLLARTVDPSVDLIRAHLGAAIYHGGVIRSLIEDRSAADPALERAMTVASRTLLTIDGTAADDLSPTSANGIAANLTDADGRPIPFLRDAAQVLRTLTLSTSGIGGFLPAGANGLPA